MDSMILHQFHVPRNCPALEMVIIVQLGGPNSYWFLCVWLSWWCQQEGLCYYCCCWSKAPWQDAKAQGLDTFEVYLGATVLAFNRKLSSPWLKCNKKLTNSSVLCRACYLLTPDIQVDQDGEEKGTAPYVPIRPINPRALKSFDTSLIFPHSLPQSTGNVRIKNGRQHLCFVEVNQNIAVLHPPTVFF